jgi:anthranilate phosphoribosyltransferase
MDEVSVSGETRVCEVNGTGSILNYSLVPGHFGVQTHPPGSVSGGTAEENAAIALSVLNGEKGPARDVVLANAALGIHVSGKGADLIGSTAMAAASIDSRRAANVLKKLVEFTNRT